MKKSALEKDATFVTSHASAKLYIGNKNVGKLSASMLGNAEFTRVSHFAARNAMANE